MRKVGLLWVFTTAVFLLLAVVAGLTPAAAQPAYQASGGGTLTSSSFTDLKSPPVVAFAASGNEQSATGTLRVRVRTSEFSLDRTGRVSCIWASGGAAVIVGHFITGVSYPAGFNDFLVWAAAGGAGVGGALVLPTPSLFACSSQTIYFLARTGFFPIPLATGHITVRS